MIEHVVDVEIEIRIYCIFSIAPNSGMESHIMVQVLNCVSIGVTLITLTVNL